MNFLCFTTVLPLSYGSNIQDAHCHYSHTGFPGGTGVKSSPASVGGARDTVPVPELGRLPGAGKASPPVFLPGKLPGPRGEPGRPQSMELQRVGHDWAHTHFLNTLKFGIRFSLTQDLFESSKFYRQNNIFRILLIFGFVAL